MCKCVITNLPILLEDRGGDTRSKYSKHVRISSNLHVVDTGRDALAVYCRPFVFFTQLHCRADDNGAVQQRLELSSSSSRLHAFRRGPANVRHDNGEWRKY